MVVTAVLLPFMFAAVAEAGPAGCTNCKVAINDVNGDGISDVFNQNTTTGLMRTNRLDGGNPAQPAIFINIGDAFAAYGGGKVSDAEGSQARRSYWITRNTSTGLVRVLKNDDTGAMPGDGNTFISVPTNWSLIGIADIDGDTREDLVFRQETGANPGLIRAYLMDAAGDVRPIANFMGFLDIETADQGWKVLGMNDMDGDGLADVVAVKVTGNNLGAYIVKITTLTCTAPTVACFGGGSTFPGVQTSDYEFVGLAYNNDDDRADVITVKPTTAISSPGLVRARLTKTGATGFTVAFPLLMPSGNVFEVEGWGNYDGVNQADILAYNPSNTNVRVFLLNPAGDGVIGGGFPLTIPATFDFSNGAPVIP